VKMHDATHSAHQRVRRRPRLHSFSNYRLKFKRPFETGVSRKQEIFVTFQYLRQAALCRKMAVPAAFLLRQLSPERLGVGAFSFLVLAAFVNLPSLLTMGLAQVNS